MQGPYSRAMASLWRFRYLELLRSQSDLDITRLFFAPTA